MRRMQPKADSLFDFLMFPQGLVVRTIDARVDGRGRAAPVTKAKTRVKSVNMPLCLSQDTRK